MKKKTVVSLVLNLLVVCVTTGVIISYFIFPGEVIRNGFESFRYFTTDSNILAAVAALFTIFADIAILRGRSDSIPRAVTLLKFVGTVAVILTFFTVMFFLIPIYGVKLLLGGTGFHMHVGAPVMSLVSLVFFEKQRKIGFPHLLLGMIPTVVYGAVYFTMVVLIGKLNGGWEDFYSFNRGGMWWITVAAMLTATFVISLLISLIYNAKIKKK